MDPLMLGGTVIGILAAVAGIVAAVVQVREYLEKRRKKPDGSAQEARPLALPSAPQIPHNLPPRREFVGREAEKARVHEALRSRYPLTSIDGIGGIGKTVLALEVAHECLHASVGKGTAEGIATFDGFIWTTAKDRDLTLNGLLDAVARTLDYPGIAQQPVEDKRVAVQKLLQEKPHLLIVDNFETITDENVRDFLLELPEPSKALITTREQKLRRAWAISLKGLTEPEALALIRNEGRRLGLAALERAVDRVPLHLFQATGGAPLAIKWAVGQIKQRGQSLDTVLAALHEARGDIFDNIFARSWDILPTSGRQVLVVMPLFATFASRAGIEAASDVHHFALDEALGQLVEMSLVDATDELNLSRLRYSIHPLTRAFAAAKLRQESKIEAYESMLEYYIQIVTPPEEKRVGDPYWDGLANYGQAETLEREWRNIEHLIRWAMNESHEAVALDLFLSIVHFLHIWGLWDERIQLSDEMCQVARNLGDPTEVWLWIDAIGHILRKRGHFSRGIQVLENGRLLARQFDLDDASMLADVYEASLHAGRNDIGSATEKIERVLEQMDLKSVLERGTPVRRIVATRAVGVAAWLGKVQQDYIRGRELHELELELRCLTGENTVSTLLALADDSLKLGDIASAERYLVQALDDAGKKDMPWIRYVKAGLAERNGQLQEARYLCNLALKQFHRFGQKDGMQACQEMLARLLAVPRTENCRMDIKYEE